MSVSIFQKIAGIALGAKARRDEEYRQFLAFFRELVETVPNDVVELFGTLTVPTIVRKGDVSNYGIVLTATDYLWWKNEIENNGARFASSVEAVKLSILTHLAKKAEKSTLTADERKSLLSLLIDASA